MKANSASAVFQVSDLDKAFAFYTEVLGFEKVFAYGTPPYYGGVKIGSVILHLNSGEENQSRRGLGSAYVFCDTVDSYYEEIVRKGAEVTSKLATWPYDMRDFQIKDPDGNLLCFGCPTEQTD